MLNLTVKIDDVRSGTMFRDPSMRLSCKLVKCFNVMEMQLKNEVGTIVFAHNTYSFELNCTFSPAG